MTSQSSRPPMYPFTAIVGQEALKLALLINGVNPRVGGVLIRGEKGTAKSTAVRALAALLPTIEVVDGCRFNCDPTRPQCPSCAGANQIERVARPVRIVNLPIGTTEDRLLGTLDLERAIKAGERDFEPGLLALAHRGILYVDEVNLLGDHLVDALLDAAAMGVNVVEREGISFSHPAEFMLIGTMNPEEGELRPQLLDRFGLSVEVRGLADPAERAEVVRRRFAFECDPAAFAARWENAEANERARIARARDLLSHVHLADDLIDLIAQLGATAQVDGLRADITIHKTALTIAALAGRRDVSVDDVRLAAELAIPHRQRRRPFEQSRFDREQIEQTIAEFEQRRRTADQTSGSGDPQAAPPLAPDESDAFPLPLDEDQGEGTEPTASFDQRHESNDQPASERVFAPEALRMVPPIVPRAKNRHPRNDTGRRSLTLSRPGRGQVISARRPPGKPKDLAIGATLRAAAPHQRDRPHDRAVALRIEPDDVREAVRRGRTGSLILFVVDASGSMGARQRMAAAKGAVLALLVDAYQRRDRVGLIAFRGDRAELLLPPTNSVELAERRLRELPTGGRTPLGHGLALAADALARARSANPDVIPFLVVVSDGRANVSLRGGDPIAESQILAAEIAGQSIQALVVDCESGHTRLGLARALGLALGADYHRLEDLTAGNLTSAIQRWSGQQESP